MMSMNQAVIQFNKLKKEIDINAFFNITVTEYQISLLGWKNDKAIKYLEEKLNTKFNKDEDNLLIEIKDYEGIQLRIVLTD